MVPLLASAIMASATSRAAQKLSQAPFHALSNCRAHSALGPGTLHTQCSCAAWHTTVQHSTAEQYRAKHSTAQHSAAAGCSAAECSATQYSREQLNRGQDKAGQGRAGQTNDHYQEPCLHQASKQRTGVAWANHLFSSSEFEIFTSLVSYLSAIQGRIVVTHTRSQHRIDIYWMTHLNFEGGQGAWGGLGDGVGVASLPL